jgi:hypothetical protein
MHSTKHDLALRPTSPWSGSQHEIEHRWQLDDASDLGEAARRLRAFAAELSDAHAAGWSLLEPMRNGYLLASRASRRRRAQSGPAPVPAAETVPAPVLSWRLRVVNEPPLPVDDVLRVHGPDAHRTSIVTSTDCTLRQISGPPLSSELLAELTRQFSPSDICPGLWAVARARVGPSVDLVADGSALRLHALHAGVLVRIIEALTFRHAADRAGSLLAAAASYERLAAAAEAMAVAGGHLVGVDDGHLHVSYGRS